jgi:exopolysaccharide biosynthesis protein
MLRRVLLASVLLLALLLSLAPAVAVGVRVPHGLRNGGRRTLAPGVQYRKLVERGSLVLHVAKVSAGAPVEFRTVTARNGVRGRPERTSSMCRRRGCLLGVNGDFFSKGMPVGGVVSLGRLLRSPARTRPHVAFGEDGSLALGKLQWSGSVVGSDDRSLRIDGVNVRRSANQIVLYTPAFGHSTKTPGGVEIGVRSVDGSGLVRLDRDATVRIYRWGRGNLYIPPDGAVLSGHGRGATELRNLWRRVAAGSTAPDIVIGVRARDGVAESLGGKGVLLRKGKLHMPRGGGAFATGLHPRTVLGWNKRGDVWLVAIDGRRPGYSRGISLRGAAVLMRRFGATEALNLDGGGSTTFVVTGRVVNRPSGGQERPVADALLVVPKPPAKPAGEIAVAPYILSQLSAATIRSRNAFLDLLESPRARPGRPAAPVVAASVLVAAMLVLLSRRRLRRTSH